MMGRDRGSYWAGLGTCVVLCASLAATAAEAPTPQRIDVNPGDSFSAIAARFTGNPGQWRKMYRPSLSNLPNPNLIVAGSQLELVQDADGRPYLRRVDGATAVAKSAAPPKVTVGAAPPAPPAPPAAPVAAPSPVVAAASAAEPAAPARDDNAFVIGVLPNIAPATLSGQYERLKRYLERDSA